MIAVTIATILGSSIIGGVGGGVGQSLGSINSVLTLISILLAMSAMWITVQHKLESTKEDRYYLIGGICLLGMVILWTSLGRIESASSIPSFAATAAMSLYVSRLVLRKKQVNE